MKISLASPVYNESERIQEFLHRSIEALHKISTDIEVVLVNDCSQDDTAIKIKDLSLQYQCIKLINLPRNSGQHIATTIALQNTTGDFVFMMDSDLQVSPEYLIEFYEFGTQIQGWDIISALRTVRSSSYGRSIGSNAISFVLKKIVNSNLKDIGSTFKLMKRRALDKLLSQDILIQNLPILMMSLNFNIIEREIKYNHHQVRKSHYKIPDLIFAIALALLNFTSGFTTLILLISIGIILLFAGGAIFLGILILGILNHSNLPTNLLIFSLVLAIVGMQFLLMGIIALKLERVNKNLDFRKSINLISDDKN